MELNYLFIRACTFFNGGFKSTLQTWLVVFMIFGWNFSSRMLAFEGRDTCSGAALVQCSILLWVIPSLMLPHRIENEVWPVWGLQAHTQRCTTSKIVLQVISLSYPWTWDLDKYILRIQNSVHVISVSPHPWNLANTNHMKSCSEDYLLANIVRLVTILVIPENWMVCS
jgi:hypothetical protein